ncbi:uncharacterized protein C2orf73 homolog [Ambystoma mexicanum]|uniref:uncharacterized protein C2orf73 homolog n=1 Tax=Ambystoma mexicanum TaxID=8296 RepID=UPI0037E87577
MYQTMEIYMARKKKAPQQFFLNTYRVFNETISGARKDLDAFSRGIQYKEKGGSAWHPSIPTCHNVPHPYYAKFIQSNVRFYNEPVPYMETDSTMDKQGHWWTSELPSINLHKPQYDLNTTQRNDFQRLSGSLSADSHHYKPSRVPASGIVPFASPRTASRLPKLLQEQLSFQHNYDTRRYMKEAPRGKRHGAFIWTEIKPERGAAGPRGGKAFLSASGSCSRQQPKAGKEGLAESSMTSPTDCLQNSQQMSDAEARLSKTDLGEAAKAYPRIPANGQHSSSMCRTSEVDGRLPTEARVEEEAQCPARDHKDEPQGGSHTSVTRLPKLPPATSTCTQPPVTTESIAAS